jgi:hypothetical protein
MRSDRVVMADANSLEAAMADEHGRFKVKGAYL